MAAGVDVSWNGIFRDCSCVDQNNDKKIMIITGQIDISLVLSFYIDVVVIWHLVYFVH